MEAAVAHEEPGELSELGRHRLGELPDDVMAIELLWPDRHAHLVGLPEQLAEGEGHEVPRSHLSETTPCPGAVGENDLGAMFGSAGDRVATLRAELDGVRQAVDEELCRLAWAFVGLHSQVHVLPRSTLGVAEVTEANQPVVGRHERPGDEAARGGDHGCLGVTDPALPDRRHHLVGGSLDGGGQVGEHGAGQDPVIDLDWCHLERLVVAQGHSTTVRAVRGATVIAQDPVRGLHVASVGSTRPDHSCHLGARRVGPRRHQGTDGTHDGTTLAGVIWERGTHEQGTKVGKAEAEGAVLEGVERDLLRRVVAHRHGDLKRRSPDAYRVLEGVGVEDLGVGVEELGQVDARQVARRVVDVEVLRAVADHDPVGHVGVVARLAQVVRDLDTVVHARHEARRLRRGVEAGRLQPLRQSGGLVRVVEADGRCEARDVLTTDAQVAHRLGVTAALLIVHRRIADRRIADRRREGHPGGRRSSRVDAGPDAEGGHQTLHRAQQLRRR